MPVLELSTRRENIEVGELKTRGGAMRPNPAKYSGICSKSARVDGELGVEVKRRRIFLRGYEGVRRGLAAKKNIDRSSPIN
jgi:hypothetical protein